jgi:hypothetical protein
VTPADAEERWRVLRTSPAIASALAESPRFPTPTIVLAPLVGGLTLGAFLAVLLVVQTGLGNVSDPPALSWARSADRDTIVALAAGAGLSLVAAVWGTVARSRFLRAPQIAAPAVVVGKRFDHFHLGRSAWLPALRMTFEFETTGRREESVNSDTFKYVVPNDVGVAWFRGGRFVGFRKVEV